MGLMRGLVVVVLLVLVSSPAGSVAIWSGKKDADPATAAEAAKQYAKDAVRNTADAAGNAGESIKQTANAAYESTANAARTATGGRSEPASGANFRDRAGEYVADTAAAAQQKTAGAAGAVKDTAANGAQAVRDSAARAYDATADTLGSAKDRVVGAPEPEPTYTRRVADAARAAGENVRDGSSRAYDATGNTLSAPFAKEDNRGAFEKAKDTLSQTGQATRDASYRTLGYEAPSDRGYASRAYDSLSGSSADAYEAGKNRLGSIVEILGWHRAPEHEATLGRFHSPYDVMVGDTRYVWHKRADEPENSYYRSARDAAAGATQTVAEKANLAAESVSDAAMKTKDATVDAAAKTKDVTVGAVTKTKDATVGAASRASETVQSKADELSRDGFLRRLWRFVHLLTWGVAFGTAVWMTFMSGRIMQQNMARDQFRTVQTKMFPSYLRFLTAAEAALAFLYHFLSNSSKWQTLNLLFLVAATAYNAFVLEPQTTKIYLDRLRLEKEEGRGITAGSNAGEELALKNKKFKESHGYSATLNLLSLLGLTYHAWNVVSKVYV